MRKRTLRKTENQDSASVQEGSKKDQTIAMHEELAALREKVAAQTELLGERAEQISDLQEDRDRWRQQAISILTDMLPINTHQPNTKKIDGGPFRALRKN